MAHRELTEQQKAFVSAYVGDAGFNGAEAARLSGYSQPNAKRCASRLLKVPGIRAAIEAVQDQLHEEGVMTYEEACLKLSDMARANLTDYVDEHCNIELYEGHPAGLLEATVRHEDNGDKAPDATITKIKVHNPIAAIERLAKLCGWDRPQKIAPTDPSGERPYKDLNDVDLAKQLLKAEAIVETENEEGE